MFEAANTLIEERLDDQWSTTEIDFDNVEFSPVIGTSFIRLQIEWTANNTISVGGLDRGEGYINLAIFVPSNTGTKAISGMADDLADIYNKWSSGYIEFGIARTVRVGQQEEWYRIDVRVPFKYDQCS